MAHAYHPRKHDPSSDTAALLAAEEPILFDGCEDCEAKVNGVLYALDANFTAALWQKMVQVEHSSGDGIYRSTAEAQACKKLYEVAVFLERHTRINPWTLFEASN